MSDTAKQLELIRAFLREESTLALATTGEQGEPNVAPLFYLVDDKLSLYWLSSPKALHSQNLRRTSRAAATVYRRAENWKEIRGVQMRGSATVITDRLRRAPLVDAYCERFHLGTGFKLVIGQSSLYEFRPDFFRYLDNSICFGYKFEASPCAEA